jgi:hypothetical protein
MNDIKETLTNEPEVETDSDELDVTLSVYLKEMNAGLDSLSASMTQIGQTAGHILETQSKT